MSSEEKVLAKLLEYGWLEQEDQKVEGIAKRAISHGYSSLTEPQKKVLSSWLVRQCDGVSDPAGDHNNCQVLLEGEALADALEQESYGDGALCESCLDESNEYERQWEQMNRD